MDRRIFDMLELYKQNNKNEVINTAEKTCHDNDFCLETNYEAIDCNVLTMAFVNMQPIESVYETEDGFSRGTIFPNIDKPLNRGGAR